MARSRRHPGPPSQLQRRFPDNSDQDIVFVLSSQAEERREWFRQNSDLFKFVKSDGTVVVCGKKECERKVNVIKCSGGIRPPQPWSRALWNVHTKICSSTGFKTKQVQQRKEILLHDPQAQLLGDRIRCRQCGHTMAHRTYKLDVWKRHRAKCGHPRNPANVAVAAASTPASALTPTPPAHAASPSDGAPSRKRRRRSRSRAPRLRRVFSTPLPDETGDELDVLGDPSQGPSHTHIDNPGSASIVVSRRQRVARTPSLDDTGLGDGLSLDPSSGTTPRPRKRQRRAAPDPDIDVDDLDSDKPRGSMPHLIRVWSGLAKKYNTRIADDDIVNLETLEFETDRGVVHRSKRRPPPWIGEDARSDDDSENDGTDDGSDGAGTDDEDDEDDQKARGTGNPALDFIVGDVEQFELAERKRSAKEPQQGENTSNGSTLDVENGALDATNPVRDLEMDGLDGGDGLYRSDGGVARHLREEDRELNPRTADANNVPLPDPEAKDYISMGGLDDDDLYHPDGGADLHLRQEDRAPSGPAPQAAEEPQVTSASAQPTVGAGNELQLDTKATDDFSMSDLGGNADMDFFNGSVLHQEDRASEPPTTPDRPELAAFKAGDVPVPPIPEATAEPQHIDPASKLEFARIELRKAELKVELAKLERDFKTIDLEQMRLNREDAARVAAKEEADAARVAAKEEAAAADWKLKWALSGEAPSAVKDAAEKYLIRLFAA